MRQIGKREGIPQNVCFTGLFQQNRYSFAEEFRSWSFLTVSIIHLFRKRF